MRSAEIPAEIRLVALDLDGVVYRGRTLLPGVEKALSAVRDRGLELRFVTNNSTLHRSAVAARLVSYGPVSYTHLRAHETDSYLVCRLLLEKKKKTKTK